MEPIVQAILDVIYPMHDTLGERFAIFEWGHEETPTEQEMHELAERIAASVRAVT